MKNKTALIEAGTYFHYFTMTDPRFSHYFDKCIYVRDLGNESLDEFDTLIIADRTPIRYLRENRDKLISFANNGGTLCILGENNAHLWLEGITYQPTPTNFWWWLEPDGDIGYKEENTNHPFFANIKLGDCKWHYHGVYNPDEKATKIIERNEEEGGGAIFYEEPFGNGRIIVTSLDPFYHTGSNFMPNAAKFLQGTLAWLHSK